MRRRRLVLGLLAAGVAAAGTGAGLSAARAANQDKGQGDNPAADAYATDTIVRGDLEGSTATSGTLGFADEHSVQAGRGGIVTALPSAGSVVHVGRPLYAVDNVPVLLLNGSIPAWRDFAIGMDDGPDVKELETNLRTLGYFDQTPDQRFTRVTAEAVRKWQKARHLDHTGRLPLGAVVFARGALRVGTATAQVGDQVGAGTKLYAATSTARVVAADVQLADQQLAIAGAKVGLRLPDGVTTTGTVTTIGAPTEKKGAGGQDEMVIPIAVTLDDPAKAGAYQQASVTVDIPSGRKKNVLSVPVSALLAIDAQRFGVEIVEDDGTTRRVPVAVGLFAGGRVEISGPDVRAGQRIVVPRR